MCAVRRAATAPWRLPPLPRCWHWPQGWLGSCTRGLRQRSTDNDGDSQGQRGEAGQMQHVERTPKIRTDSSLSTAPLGRITWATLLTNSEVQRWCVLTATAAYSRDRFTGFNNVASVL